MFNSNKDFLKTFYFFLKHIYEEILGFEEKSCTYIEV